MYANTYRSDGRRPALLDLTERALDNPTAHLTRPGRIAKGRSPVRSCRKARSRAIDRSAARPGVPDHHRPAPVSGSATSWCAARRRPLRTAPTLRPHACGRRPRAPAWCDLPAGTKGPTLVNPLIRKLEQFAELSDEDRRLVDEAVRDVRRLEARQDII